MKYKQKDEQQHELMFNFDEDTSHPRSRDSTKVLPCLNKSEVTSQFQNLHDSHEVTPLLYPFDPNSPRWITRQSNPHEWYYHKISNATAEVILLERERKNGNFIVHSNSNGEYYLLVCFEQKAIHMRIFKDMNEKFFLDGLYCNNKKSFDGLDELVNYYREIPLVVEDKLIVLTDL
ncbi:PREDICTED: uncharacterized protein LOC105313392 [Amphimedon queenslandica]|uniref:SH2 domain-containing protein n=1 Tax=Amphimedon queenslandica TaxID=400682 RepID=A0A1X7UHN2_AMPQE|nr:PREDICTED: uncharacterized protein LOC105313392 [Amphimedon queenslandica]|eukprot:XP_011405080.1 PREDICTED: uncharacterized protein LOC105313392 [Amphimedon queenslandica]